MITKDEIENMLTPQRFGFGLGVLGTIVILLAGALFVTYLMSIVWNIIEFAGIVLIFLGVLSYIKIKNNPVKIPKNMVTPIIAIGFVAILIGFFMTSGLPELIHPFSFLQGLGIPSMNLFGSG
jgi:hypothetical protein